MILGETKRLSHTDDAYFLGNLNFLETRIYSNKVICISNSILKWILYKSIKFSTDWLDGESILKKVKYPLKNLKNFKNKGSKFLSLSFFFLIEMKLFPTWAERGNKTNFKSLAYNFFLIFFVGKNWEKQDFEKDQKEIT